MITWIDISHKLPHTSEPHNSSLGISSKDPNWLMVTGGISHASDIRPKTKRDADLLIKWIESVKESLPN